MGGMFSGDSGSGARSWEIYLENFHSQALLGISGTLNDVHGNSPFAGAVAADPTSDYTDFRGDVSDFYDDVIAIDPIASWEAFLTFAASGVDTYITDATSANADIAADSVITFSRITNTILPRFRFGKDDLLTVVSGAYSLGETNILSFAQDDINKYSANLKLSNYQQRNDLITRETKDILSLFISKFEYNKVAMHYKIESARVKLVMQNDQQEQQLTYDEKDTVWELSIWQYMNNLLASITGATGSTPANRVTTRQKALGGTLSGAALGTQAMGPGYGTLIGAAVGGFGGAMI